MLFSRAFSAITWNDGYSIDPFELIARIYSQNQLEDKTKEHAEQRNLVSLVRA